MDSICILQSSLLIAVAVVLAFPVSCGQSLFELNDWVYWRGDSRLLLQRHLTRDALSLLAIRRSELSKLKTANDWKMRGERVAADLQLVFGPLPHNEMPLKSNITGSYKAEGYTVYKVYFESRPQFFVTGGLFVPDNAVKSKTPGILFASGHTPQAWRSTNENSEDGYQLVISNLAKKGFVVFAYDPPSQGERCMYCDQNTKKSVVGGCTYDIETGQSTGGSCTTEHNYYGRQLFLNNITAASIWVWDGMRALDYLTSRAEVDVDKLGMCGCSGGGTQTAYLSAVDSRILASSVACYMSTFEADFTYQGSADAEQQWMNGLPLGLDKADLLEVRAPKPTQALLTTDDTVFPVQGGRDCVQVRPSAIIALKQSCTIVPQLAWEF